MLVKAWFQSLVYLIAGTRQRRWTVQALIIYARLLCYRLLWTVGLRVDYLTMSTTTVMSVMTQLQTLLCVRLTM